MLRAHKLIAGVVMGLQFVLILCDCNMNSEDKGKLIKMQGKEEEVSETNELASRKRTVWLASLGVLSRA